MTHQGRRLVLAIWPLLLAGAQPDPAGQGARHSYHPAQGFVPDAATAVKVAEAVLGPVYGLALVERERPFVARLDRGVWFVEGSPSAADQFGGVAHVEIAKRDAAVRRMTHER